MKYDPSNCISIIFIYSCTVPGVVGAGVVSFDVDVCVVAKAK